MRLIQLNDKDNVAVVLESATIPFGHKVALRDIKKGENIIKYGHPIGHATSDIARGEWVHVHNMATNYK